MRRAGRRGAVGRWVFWGNAVPLKPDRCKSEPGGLATFQFLCRVTVPGVCVQGRHVVVVSDPTDATVDGREVSCVTTRSGRRQETGALGSAGFAPAPRAARTRESWVTPQPPRPRVLATADPRAAAMGTFSAHPARGVIYKGKSDARNSRTHYGKGIKQRINQNREKLRAIPFFRPSCSSEERFSVIASEFSRSLKASMCTKSRLPVPWACSGPRSPSLYA